MAITMSASSQKAIFLSLFGPTSPEANIVDLLLQKGVLFETSLYMIKAAYAGSVYQVTTSVGTTTLMKKSCAPEVQNQNVLLVSEWLKNLSNKVLGTATKTSVPPTPPGETEYEPKEWQPHMQVPKGSATKVYSPKVYAPKGAAPVKLAGASKLGQSVFGTSAGSVYRVVAVGTKANVAVRLSDNETEMSVRVEWGANGGLTPAEVAALKGAGLSIKGADYASTHLNLGNVPWFRALAALLVSLHPLEFPQFCQTKPEMEAANA